MLKTLLYWSAIIATGYFFGEALFSEAAWKNPVSMYTYSCPPEPGQSDSGACLFTVYKDSKPVFNAVSHGRPILYEEDGINPMFRPVDSTKVLKFVLFEIEPDCKGDPGLCEVIPVLYKPGSF